MSINRLVSVAPMMDWTDRHFRSLIRIMSKHTLLFTEMITTGAILHGDRDYLLEYSSEEHPLALQLGGSNPDELAACAQIASEYGYDEINLNVGCPSDRVQSGRFGACLMKEPDLVASACQAISDVVSLPVTVKCRIGVDEYDSYEYFRDFIFKVAEAGVNVFYIHARKAWLEGLSPKQNRTVPPLRYDYVNRLKIEAPQLEIIVNGGIINLKQARDDFKHLDGIMIGRLAYQDPYQFASVDSLFFNENSVLTRQDVVSQFTQYAYEQYKKGVSCTYLCRHIMGLFHGAAGAKTWRRYLSQFNHRRAASPDVFIQALSQVENTLK